uniref:Uncharacterized protein n=1 Tax=Micrurus surinamensis TaxID=129470 RepID=A0A2D4PNR1_MICSU
MVASSRGPIFLPPPAKCTQALWVSSHFCSSRWCAKISFATPGISTAKGSLMFRSTLEAGKSFWAGEPSLLCLPHSVNLQSRGGHRCKVACQSLRGQVVEEGQELGGRKGQISKPDSTKVINRRLALVSGCYDDRQGYAPQRYGSGTEQPLPWNCPGGFIFALRCGAAGPRVPQHLAVHLCLDALLVSVLLGQFRELGVNGLI